MALWQQWLERIVQPLQKFVWGPWMLVLFVGTGIWMTLGSGFFQLRGLKLWWENTVGAALGSAKKENSEGISPAQAACTALAATIGTGNIAGVATAIAAGGPGAVFWMEASALLGTMTCFAENVLGSLYRYKDAQGVWHGGAMAYLERGLHAPFLAKGYALFCLLSTLGMGGMVQAHSIASAAQRDLEVSPVTAGFVVAVLAALTIMGGVQRIARVAQALVPGMALIYLGAAFWVVLHGAERIPQVLVSICREAFTLRAGMGAAAGYTVSAAIRMGVSRGVFSNEAGLGTSVLAHIESTETRPVVQGMWGIFQVTADTLVVCTLTALAILTSGVYDGNVYGSALGTSAFSALPNGAALTAAAFGTVFGEWGGKIVSLVLMLFAFSTVLASSYFGGVSAEYLLGHRAVVPYKMVFICILVVGSALKLDVVWMLSDVFNGLMALPNLLGVLVLSPQVLYQLRAFCREQHCKSGEIG